MQMWYFTKQTMEQRHLDRYSGLIEMGSFKGMNLKRNNPNNAKRNDHILVTGAKFIDGTVMTVVLKSDNQHYFFFKHITCPNGHTFQETCEEVPYERTYCEKPTEGYNPHFTFTMNDDLGNVYTLYLEYTDDHQFVVAVNSGSPTQTIRIFEGVQEELPEITVNYIADVLSGQLLAEYNNNMAKIAAFLQNIKSVTYEERESCQADTWKTKAAETDPAYLKEFASATLTVIEQRTCWDKTRQQLEPNQAAT